MAGEFTPGSDDWFKEKLKNQKELIRESKNWRDSLDGISRDERKAELEGIKQKKEALSKLTLETEEQKKNAEELLKIYEKQEKIYKSQYEVTGRITQEVKVTYRQFQNFLTTSADQYNYAQKIAKEYLMVSRNIGAGAAHQERLTRTFKDTLPEVEQMGGSMEDITNMMETMADESGRMKILDNEDVINIEKISRGVNLSASETAKMAEMFDLMGISTNAMTKGLEDVFKESQKLGLNASKVVKQLSSNMKSIQSYSFASGVRGMTEMAKQAVKMRIDVSDVLQMADKFYQPEAAIEAAANLQMLGGDIAKAFGDPFETMYMARNKPEELANKLEDMTKNMLQFNEESGRYELPAEARMQLKAAGDQLGINTEKMVEMARQSSKINDLKMKFTAIGDNEMKENLASLAKFSEEKGEFVIQHNGEELGLDEVNESMVDEIMEANANEGKTDSDLFKNIAINTQTMSEQLQSLKESGKAAIAGGTDLYEITAENMKKTLVTPMKNTMDVAVKQFQEAFKPGALFESDEWTNATNEFGETMGKMGDELNDFINNLPKIPTNTGPGNTNNTGDPNSGPGNTGNPTASVTKNQNINLDVAINGSGTFTPAQLQMIQDEITRKIVNGIEIKTDGTDIEVVINNIT
tara:strand:- start:264 stop:2180 length:1917 start_codon:yes stop_codon:yes gene_type:complete